MQLRRYRPGDVLDDYCPRERRITDHAVVAMIDDHIKQTRCCVCDADHEYKDGKVPPQRRKKPQAALFTQVLDGLQGPQPAARLPHHPEADSDSDAADDAEEFDEPDVAPALAPALEIVAQITVTDAVLPIPPALLQAEAAEPDGVQPMREDGPVRRPLIRATLPRPEGQPVQPTRVMPEFTIRQPSNGRGGHRPAGSNGRRHGGSASQAPPGPMRFGRTDRGTGNGHGGSAHGQGPRQHGGRSQGPGQGQGQGQGNGGRPGGSRRGGKKQR
ncbi:MAG TPA: hypothetical protein VNJ02_00550 [Vicinamibacterales bacterium]|nr:hypothetical protein [Vicinamibacterales bacterium]